ncbi:F-box associated domain type 3 [Arabidopsis suecica]|uniref:F-box associated domain type 3 n=1 Tax=Arabidopsis suecica TaxID=45249 RepID=A0A8T2BWA1_ARASU|nr:F-box associated domain type 3 [Arabidopsis suecica]
MLASQAFTRLFVTRSSSNPRLLIGVEQDGEWRFYSSPQPKNPYDKSSLVVAADFHMKFSEGTRSYGCSYAFGLIYFRTMWISKEGNDQVGVICNPSTGQYAILPPEPSRSCRGILGFDPICKQFKVLVLNNPDIQHILTLGTKNVRWRSMQRSLRYVPREQRPICINGVLYYIAYDLQDSSYDVIGCFHVRFEKFKFLHVNYDMIDSFCVLVNYKGKLGGIYWEYADDGGFPLELSMWVLEDLEKNEWSEYAYTLKADNNVVKVNYNLSVVGVTARGEIVLAKQYACKPFYVFYFNPERSTLLSVEIQGVGEDHRVCVFVDHVEDLHQFDNMKKSISLPQQKLKPTSTSTSSKNNHQVMTSILSRKYHQARTSTSSRKNHQVRTVSHPQQDRRTSNKFSALCLLDDDEFSGV